MASGTWNAASFCRSNAFVATRQGLLLFGRNYCLPPARATFCPAVWGGLWPSMRRVGLQHGPYSLSGLALMRYAAGQWPWNKCRQTMPQVDTENNNNKKQTFFGHPRNMGPPEQHQRFCPPPPCPRHAVSLIPRANCTFSEHFQARRGARGNVMVAFTSWRYSGTHTATSLSWALSLCQRHCPPTLVCVLDRREAREAPAFRPPPSRTVHAVRRDKSSPGVKWAGLRRPLPWMQVRPGRTYWTWRTRSRHSLHLV